MTVSDGGDLKLVPLVWVYAPNFISHDMQGTLFMKLLMERMTTRHTNRLQMMLVATATGTNTMFQGQ